jgi:RecB family exonuclease
LAEAMLAAAPGEEGRHGCDSQQPCGPGAEPSTAAHGAAVAPTPGPNAGWQTLLGPLPASVSSLDVAVTALADFEHCPMLYRWRYELGIPSRPRGRKDGRGRGGNSAMTDLDPAELGTFLHRCMEILDFSHPQPADLLARAAAEELQLAPEVSREGLARELQPMLDAFLHYPLGRELASAKGRLAELEFLLREGPVRLSGKIDLLWQDVGGAWHILDYKSDRAEGKDLADYARRYELQMMAYALAASRHLAGAGPGKSAVIDATLYFLRLGKAETLRIDAGKLESATQRLADIASRLIAARRTGEFPRCGASECGHCAYGHYCEAVAGTAAPIDA